ncbi:MAG: glycoside hydrolase family 9 protein [Opitutaceae bacterium]|nr:glycoside hydrolase family 9 protein [Opitutaceae bacterium]
MPNRFLFASLLVCTIPAATAGHAPTRTSVDPHSLNVPAVGDATLQILSPSLLEFTAISTKEKNASWVQLKNTPAGRADATPGTTPRFEVTVAGRRIQVVAVGVKRRVLYAPLARRDLRVATHFYLRLGQPIATDAGAPVVELRVVNIEAGKPPLTLTARLDPGRRSPAIHVNQEGYVPSLPKKAMVGYYLGDMGEMEISAASGFTLVDALTGKSVYAGALAARRDVGYKTTPPPYQQVLVADFSDFAIPGEYRLRVAGLGDSLPFLIDDGIAMGFARTYALGLYHQRCGSENALPFSRFAHGACHLPPAQIPSPGAQFGFTWTTLGRSAAEASPDNPAQTAPPLTRENRQLYPFVNHGTVDVSGGHHDAGDYSKYTVNSAELIHYLAFTVDSIPGVAAMDNLGLPESGDGISDILQEAKREADYLAKLQDADGGFYFLVYPKTREYEANVLPDHGDAQVVWPKNTAVTAAAVAALAQCASSPNFRRHFPAAAAGYLKQAELGWRFLMQAVAKHGKAGAYQKITFYGDHYTHDDELAWAACELFLATGSDQYQQKLYTWFPNPADYTTFRWGWWRMSEGWGNAIRSYAFAARTGRLPGTALDARYLRICEGEIVSAGDNVLDWSAKNAYATPFPIATKAVQGAGWYYSLDQASDMAVAYLIEPKPAYLDALVGAMNYEGGGNPVNVAYLTGLGVGRQREIVHHYAQNDRRTLPPSGIPLGNLQAAFQHLPAYGFELRDASYPDDNAAVAPFPFYDRWSDAYNVTTEFIAVNQARGLLATAFLAQRTAAATKAWRPLRADIVGPKAPLQVNTPVTLRLEVPGESLAGARIVWEARDQSPAFGSTCVFSPKSNGPQWIEAEIAWPDGRRAFAATTLTAASALDAWLDDSLPADAVPASTGGDGWNWVAANPAPQSGARAHQSNLAAGVHEHWFTNASATLAIDAGDVLFAWVFLDPKNPPTEIMLMWNDGSSWEHRAYWGANTLTYGKDRSAGRHPMGPLPPTGKWIRLSVPAQAVALEGVTINGMGFSHVDGRATWDNAGRAAAERKP